MASPYFTQPRAAVAAQATAKPTTPSPPAGPHTAAPTAAHINAERLAAAVDDAYAAGKESGYVHGYVDGVRVGRVAMLLWGAGAGALLTLAVQHAPHVLALVATAAQVLCSRNVLRPSRSVCTPASGSVLCHVTRSTPESQNASLKRSRMPLCHR